MGQSEFTPTAAFKHLKGDIYAAGAGASIKLGVKDTKPPVISIDFPEE
ncbi:hypothetical protein K7I13_05810 [Brucepastera parasyntrophica]|nr:hypothetical protein [Brucepastera parasyntrophica]ULQ60783.1 hypothetical protein K7I13_05810 [Brucepastera parasyntrophica]